MPFPTDFAWGAASAAYQIEGAAFEDGRGLSVWDMFCRRPNAVWEGQSGEVSCDHYHHYREDVALMQSLGIKAYRLSISWPRVLPEGTGRVNPKGLAFYDALIDALLEAGITPWVTLYHWDMPYELYCRGGWLNPESANWFAEYARLMAEHFSDRVTHWMTLNEPQCFLQEGHREGTHAPGDQLNWPEVLLAAHHVLLAHGKSMQALRASAQQPLKIGFAPVGETCMPATETPADIEAARLAMFSIFDWNLWNNTWFADPVLLGHYPEDGLVFYGKAVPDFPPADMDIIRQPLDFYGMNTYRGAFVRVGSIGIPEEAPLPLGYPQTSYNWQITPECLYWGPRFFWERYHLPIVVTENGLANADWIAEDGGVHDPQRIDYTRRHLRQLKQAIEDGVPVEGYFHWSIMDNFEWAQGYRQRFGLIYVDYPSSKRIPKDSAQWYKRVIATNGEKL